MEGRARAAQVVILAPPKRKKKATPLIDDLICWYGFAKTVAK